MPLSAMAAPGGSADSARGVQSLHGTAFVLGGSLRDGHPDECGCEEVSPCGPGCVSLTISDAERRFMRLLAVCASLGKRQVFPHVPVVCVFRVRLLDVFLRSAY